MRPETHVSGEVERVPLKLTDGVQGDRTPGGFTLRRRLSNGKDLPPRRFTGRPGHFHARTARDRIPNAFVPSAGGGINSTTMPPRASMPPADNSESLNKILDGVPERCAAARVVSIRLDPPAEGRQ